MAQKKKRGSAKFIWFASAAIAVVLIAGGVMVAFMLISDDEGRRRQVVQMVTLVKPPPPPPPVKEKPPEPEMKKEEIIEDKKEEPRQEETTEADDQPAGDQLGLDAEGGAGSDSFGLVGKKGGRALIGGDSGEQSLLRKYAWYTAIIQEEIKKRVRKTLDENGGIPKGKLEAVVRLVMDEGGAISEFRIIGSSGNHSMDEAVKEALASARIREAPPRDMPRAMKIKVTSKG
jgi:TonB family protein